MRVRREPGAPPVVIFLFKAAAYRVGVIRLQDGGTIGFVVGMN